MRKRMIRKQVLSVLTAFALVCSGLSLSSFARTGTVRAAESGETEEEYIPITNVSELYAIRNNLSGKYRLMNDIDLTEATSEGGEVNNTGHGWSPINCFEGVLDGNGHVIRGMKIYGEVSGDIGLFGVVYTPVIRNLGLVDVDIDVTSSSGINCGALVGYGGYSRIENCFVSGTIKVSGASSTKTGGFVGYVDESLSIYNSYNLADVLSVDSTGKEPCAFTAGLVGNYAYIYNSYNAGNINNGQGYAIVGSGFVQSENTFYLEGTASKGEGTPLTEAQMKNRNYFTEWDFDSVWEIDSYSAYKYPQLRSCRQTRVKSLTIETPPAKTIYDQGEPLNITDATLKVVYEDGYETVIFLTEDMLGDYDMMSVGKQQIPIYKENAGTTLEIMVNAIPVTSVKMSKSSTSIDKGCTGQLSASVVPENATEQGVTWSSADVTIATVSQAGRVTGKKTGTTTIYATSTNGVKAECRVTITVPCVLLILDKNEITMNKGDTYVPGYKVSPVDSTDTVQWTSADDTVVHIDDENQLVGVSGGTTTVTGVAESGESAQCTVTVMQDLSDFTVLDIQDKEYTGKAITQTPKVTNGTKTLREGVDYSLEYSSNTEIGTATVRITGIGCYKGTLTREFKIVQAKISSISIKKAPAKTFYKQGEELDITDAVVRIVYENGAEAEVPLTKDMIGDYDMMSVGTQKVPVRIQDAETFIIITVSVVKVTKITISKDSLLLEKGKQEKLTVSVLPEDAVASGIKWSSADETIASVAGDGTVTGKKAGKTTIRAASENGVTAECTVTVMKELSECTVSEIKDQIYTGAALTPALVVTDGTKTLREGVDYSLEYSSNTEAGTATVKITGIGCYKGTLTREFKIVQIKISSISIEKAPAKTSYKQGEELDITDAAVRIVYENGAEAEVPLTKDMLGDYDMMLVGTQKIPVRIQDAETFIEISVTAVEVTKVTISKDSLLLEKGKQEKLTVSVLPEDAVAPGIKWSSEDETIASVAGDGTVTGNNAGTTTIRAASENGVTAECKVTVTIPCELQFGESEITIDVGDTCMIAYEILPEGTTDVVTWISEDETVVAINEDNELVGVGVGTVKVNAVADSGATAVCTVTVMKELSECTVSEIKDETFTGAALTPALVVTDGTKTLRAGEDYSLEYSSNTEVGTATVKITGAGFYKGTLTREFHIVPAKADAAPANNSSVQQEINKPSDNNKDKDAVQPVRLSKAKFASIKASKKKLVIRWKQVANASGYKIEIAKNRSFTKRKKVYTVGKKTLKKTFKGAKKTTYYIRVQAYAYNGDGKISYGKYSSVKKKKTK